jgi:hypothetical protein
MGGDRERHGLFHRGPELPPADRLDQFSHVGVWSSSAHVQRFVEARSKLSRSVARLLHTDGKLPIRLAIRRSHNRTNVERYAADLTQATLRGEFRSPLRAFNRLRGPP